MSEMPLISVVTVTYNAGNVVDKTLNSLKEQTFGDFEHLVVDGKSKDDTCEKVKVNALPQTRLVSEPDKGLYDAMNKGMRMAKGKYVIFLNAGDKFHNSDTLNLYAEAAKKGADIVYGDTIIVDSTGNKISDRHLKVPQKLTKDSFSKGMLICHQAFMAKKEIVPEFDLSYRFSADYDWCIKCIEKTQHEKCYNLNSVTIDYLSDGLTDKNKIKSLKERFRIMSRHYGLVKTISNHIGFVLRALKRGKL